MMPNVGSDVGDHGRVHASQNFMEQKQYFWFIGPKKEHPAIDSVGQRTFVRQSKKTHRKAAVGSPVGISEPLHQTVANSAGQKSKLCHSAQKVIESRNGMFAARHQGPSNVW